MFEILEYLTTGVILSIDAMAVCIVCGIKMPDFSAKHIWTLALSFGFAQGIMPALGWLGGTGIYRWVSPVDHWIAFGLLLFVGGRMIHEARSDEDEKCPAFTVKSIFMLAIATSLDALSIGLTYAMLERPILLPACIFIVITTLCSALAGVFGNKLSSKFGKHATLVGGIVLILIGLKIIIEHLFFNGEIAQITALLGG